MISLDQMIARIAAGAVLGAMIGYERDRRGRPAGLRTHLLVAMASATFMVVSTQYVYFQGHAPTEHVSIDGSRIASSVVSGIGFLAGGAILHTGITVQGLTTAAGLWLVTAIGLCAGAGMYLVSLIVTVMGITALTVVRRFEDREEGALLRKVSVVLDGRGSAAALTSSLTAARIAVEQVDQDRHLEEGRVMLDFLARLPRQLGVDGLMALLESQPGVRRVQIRTP